MAKTIRLIIADDHALFRQGLKSLLLLQAGIEIVAEVERSSELVSVLAAIPCDVLLLDLQLERWVMNDIEELSHKVRIVVVTASERKEDGFAALRMGARAIVQKRFAVETLVEAVRTVADGLVWMPRGLQAEVASQWRPSGAQLSNRETEIIRCVATGLRNAEVAERLSIGESTVKTHLNNIFQKLGIRDRVGLALYAIRVGLVGVQDRN